MILCWGFSIHARRRAEVFIEDERFEVTLVSTYNYQLHGANNVLLGSAKMGSEIDKKKVTEKKKFGSSMSPSIKEVVKKILKLLGMPCELRAMHSHWRILREAAAKSCPHVVLLQTLQYPSFLAYLLPLNLPIAVTFWNGDLTYFAKWTGIEMLIKKWLVIYGLRRAQALTVNSKTAFNAAIQLGADPEKLNLIRYPGADLSRFQPSDKRVARERLEIGARYVLLCPRGLGSFFNSDVLVEAAAIIAQSFPDILLLFVSGVGGQEEWKQHLALGERLGIADRMRWDGQVEWEIMPLYYAACDVMISVKTADSCPNCMLEAMACGVPVVMSDTKQNQEWIKDGINGFLCGPRDANKVALRAQHILSDSEGIVSRFTALSLEKVRAEANSATNSARMKDLVVSLAQ